MLHTLWFCFTCISKFATDHCFSIRSLSFSLCVFVLTNCPCFRGWHRIWLDDLTQLQWGWMLAVWEQNTRCFLVVAMENKQTNKANIENYLQNLLGRKTLFLILFHFGQKTVFELFVFENCWRFLCGPLYDNVYEYFFHTLKVRSKKKVCSELYINLQWAC